jgi:ABC-type sulfate/molybdate transport systems ATPase subunit
MTAAPVPVLHLQRIRKNYGGLRPLRLDALVLAAEERVAVAGLDGAGAEVLVNLVTGATLPDEGQVRVLGQPTSDLTADTWLPSLDRFGIVSARAALLEGATLEQNLAMAYTLDLDPVPPDVAARVRALWAEIATEAWLAQPTGGLPPEVRARAHLVRALALDPALLLLEHPTADLPESARAAFGADVAGAAGRRRLTALAITNDDAFAAAMAHRHLRLDGATGRLRPARKTGWWR